MKSITLISLALAVAGVSAQPKKHMIHHLAMHEKRALEKRDTVVFTELVVMTECVTTSVTSYITDGGNPTTIVPASINTAPQTKIIGSTLIKDPVSGGIFQEQSSSSSSTTSSSVVAAPPSSQASQASEAAPVTTPSATPSTTPSATSSEPAQPTGSNLPPPAGSSSNLYNLAMPPTKQGWITECTSSTCTGIASYYNGLTDEMCCGYNGMAGQDDVKRIAAVPAALMGSASNSNSVGVYNQPTNGNCGRMISVSVKSTGMSTTVQVVDKCPGCKSTYGLDLSPAAFAALGVSQDTGIVEIEWQFM